MFTVNLDNFAIPLVFFFRLAFGSKKINEIFWINFHFIIVLHLLMTLSEFNSFYPVILQMTAELFCEIYNSRSPLYIIPLYILAWLYQTIFLQAVRILW